MTESWGESRVRRVREMGEIDEADMQRSKKRKRGHYNGDTQWGLIVLGEEEKERQKWLSDTCSLKEQKCKEMMKQSELQPWSGTILMSRDLVLEVVVGAAERIEKRAVEARMCHPDDEKSPELKQEQHVEENAAGNKAKEQIVSKEKTPKIDKPKTSNQDIRDLVRRNKEQVLMKRVEKKKETDEETMLKIAAKESEK